MGQPGESCLKTRRIITCTFGVCTGTGVKGRMALSWAWSVWMTRLTQPHFTRWRCPARPPIWQIRSQKRPILPGTYQLMKHTGSQNPALNGKPKLYGGNLAASRGILMHGGEDSKSSTGCIIFGLPAGWGRLTHSNHIWHTILKPWLDACNWHAQIHIEH